LRWLPEIRATPRVRLDLVAAIYRAAPVAGLAPDFTAKDLDKPLSFLDNYWDGESWGRNGSLGDEAARLRLSDPGSSTHFPATSGAKRRKYPALAGTAHGSERDAGLAERDRVH